MGVIITSPPSIPKTKGPSGQTEELAANWRKLTFPSAMLRKFTGEFSTREPGSTNGRENILFVYMYG